MNKTYIAPYDFNPRMTGELRIAKYDRIIISDIGHGWCWGKNTTQGGQEGIFPKRYLSGPRPGLSGFNKAVDEVASVCSRMDMLIAKSPYLTSPQDRASLLSRQTTLQSLGPFSYLTSGCAGPIWEECLQNFVSAFQETRVKAHEYLRCLENLKRLAAMLDRSLPQLSDEARKYSEVLPAVLRNAECMQATLRGLIATASAAFEWYKPKDTKTCPLQLYPSNFTTYLRGTAIELIPTETQPSPSRLPPSLPTSQLQAQPFALLPPPSASSTLTSSITTATTTILPFPGAGYPTLQALTILTCLVACTLQLRAYALSPHGPGTLSDPDFYGNLQSVLMQLLTAYTGLAAPPSAIADLLDVRRQRQRQRPEQRQRGPGLQQQGGDGGGGCRGRGRGHGRGRPPGAALAAAFWVAFLSVAAVVLNVASAAAYFRDGALAPLLGFFGGVVQAITVLQLAVRVDDARGGCDDAGE